MTIRRTQGKMLAAALCVMGGVAPAAAHLDLLQPIPREQGRFRVDQITNTNLKEGPCGQRENGRTSKLNVFSPGETITLVWDEYVNHRSYYRVAFDIDGDDDLPRFAGPGIEQDEHDPRDFCPVDGRVILAYELNDQRGGQYTLDVTLPEVECDNCTLQVIQYMYGRERARPYYFQCADLVLRHSGDAGLGFEQQDAGGPDGGAVQPDASLSPRDAGRPDAGARAARDSQFKAAASCWQQLEQAPLPELAELPVATTPVDNEAPPEPSDTEDSSLSPDLPQTDSGECGCRLAGASHHSSRNGWWSLAGLIIVFGARRWRMRESRDQPSSSTATR